MAQASHTGPSSASPNSPGSEGISGPRGVIDYTPVKLAQPKMKQLIIEHSKALISGRSVPGPFVAQSNQTDTRKSKWRKCRRNSVMVVSKSEAKNDVYPGRKYRRRRKHGRQ